MTSKHLPVAGRPAEKPLAGRSSIAAATLITVVGLVGCSQFSGQVGVSSPEPAPTSGISTADLAPETVQLAAAVRDQLDQLTRSNPKPGGQEMAKALLAAGVTAGNIEVSRDRTPTGLDVDAIDAATKIGEDCVFGQVRDGMPTVTVLPVLKTGRCFFGD